ncbi:MAG: MFS transporter [Eubacteriales bacterium]|nr:MFS transporter [Eubacteriales bacterium]
MNALRFRLRSPWQDEPPEFRRKYLQYSGMEFLFWFAMAAASYLTVFLQSQGLSATACSIVNSLCAAVGIIATPFWGAISDKIRSVRVVFLICLLIGSLLWALVPVTSSVMVGPIMLSILVVIVANFFRAPISSLMDNWVVQASYRERLNYGSVRSWGSLSFAIMGIALSFILPRLGGNVAPTFYLALITAIPLFILCYSVKDDVQKRKAVPLHDMNIGRLLQNKQYLLFLAFVALLQISVSTAINLLPFLVTTVHGDPSKMGLITGYRALLEIPMLLLLKPLRKKVPLYWMLIGCTVLYAIECSLYSVATAFWQIVLISTFHGLGGGLYIASASNYVYTLAPDDLKATAQTLFGSVLSVAGIFGNFFGGMLMDAIGVTNFYVTAGVMSLLSGLLYAGSFLLRRRRQTPDLPA